MMTTPRCTTEDAGRLGRTRRIDPAHQAHGLEVLRDRVRDLPWAYRRDLEPLVEEAIEAARLQRHAMDLASDALKRLRDEAEAEGTGTHASKREPTVDRGAKGAATGLRAAFRVHS